MVLRYLGSMNPEDEHAQTIMESDTVAPMVSCVEYFWENLGYQIPYFRCVDFKEKGIIIDFGQHHRFYHVIGYGGSFQEFVTEWEKVRK